MAGCEGRASAREDGQDVCFGGMAGIPEQKALQSCAVCTLQTVCFYGVVVFAGSVAESQRSGGTAGGGAGTLLPWALQQLGV